MQIDKDLIRNFSFRWTNTDFSKTFFPHDVNAIGRKSCMLKMICFFRNRFDA